MQYLSPIDASFLIGETRQQMAHIGSLTLYQLPEDSTATSHEHADQLFDEMTQWTTAYAPFNYRLTKKWGRYAWLEEEVIDVHQHLFRLSLDQDASFDDALEAMCELHSVPLDRSKPLWRAWIVSGLPNNQIGMYIVMHHALIDGVSASRMLKKVHDGSGKPFWAHHIFQATPSNKASNNTVKKKKPSLIRELTDQVPILWNHSKSLLNAQKGLLKNSLYTAPATPFNQPISHERTLACDHYALKDLKALAVRLNASINDILLLMMSESIRDYLLDTHTLPDEELFSFMPISIRTEDSMGGNQVAMVRMGLGTHLAEQVERVDHVLSNVSETKRRLKGMTSTQILTYGLLTTSPFSWHALSGKLPMFQTANTVLSNVTGPDKPLIFRGMTATAHYPISMIVNQMGMNVTVVSYNQQLYVGIIACAKQVPDVAQLTNGMRKALDSLNNLYDI